MDSNREESICLCCYLQTCINVAFIYGVDPFIPCNHHDRHSLSHLKKLLIKIYFGLIEFILWENVFHMLWILIPGLNLTAPCRIGYSIYKNNATIVETALLALGFISASLFTFMRRNKISLDIKLRSKDFSQQKMAQNNKVNANKIFTLISFIINSFILWIIIVMMMFTFPYWQKAEKFIGEAIFCMVHYGIWANFLIGGLGHFLILAILFLWVAAKEFQQIFKELALMKMDDVNLHFKLEKFMMHHEQLWKWIAQINYKYSYIAVMIYIGITSGTSFCYYMYLFIEMKNVFRYFVLGLVVLLTFVCIIYGLMLSSFSFNMLNTFQDIRIYTGSSLPLEQKLKILDFMKRFGSVPLLLSVGGFFNINKRFPMKMASTLHSVFSGLLKLRDVTHPEADCLEVNSTVNSTEFY